MRMGPWVMRSGLYYGCASCWASSAKRWLSAIADYAGYAETTIVAAAAQSEGRKRLCDQHLVGQTSTLLAQLREQLPGQET